MHSHDDNEWRVFAEVFGLSHSIHVWHIIFSYIHHKNQPNVGIYTIHGSYGFGEVEGSFLATTCQHLKPLILGIPPNGMPPESFAGGKRAHEDLDSVKKLKMQMPLLIFHYLLGWNFKEQNLKKMVLVCLSLGHPSIGCFQK